LQALPTLGKRWSAPAASKWHFARRDTSRDATRAGVLAMEAFLQSIAFNERPFIDTLRPHAMTPSADGSPAVRALAALCAPRTMRQWVRWGCPHVLCRAIASSGSQLLLQRPDLKADGWPLLAPADSAHPSMLPVVVSMLPPGRLQDLMGAWAWTPPEHRRIKDVLSAAPANSDWKAQSPFAFLSAISDLQRAAAVVLQAGYKPTDDEKDDALEFMMISDSVITDAPLYFESS